MNTITLKPTIEEVEKIKAEGIFTTVPVSTEIFSDIKTPTRVMRVLMEADEHCYMLESAEDNEKWGRYTFLGFKPKMEITCENGNIKIDGKPIEERNPEIVLRNILSKYKAKRFDYLPPFAGGLVGYFSYDYLKYSEPTLNLDALDTEHFKDVDLMLFDKVIAFDNYRRKIILISNINLENDIKAEFEKAQTELFEIERLIRFGKEKENIGGKLLSDVKPLFSKEEYCKMVRETRHHIVEGDIFRLVLSNRLEADFEGSLFNAYRMLRTVNPSPYMFYFSGSDMEVAGASPETLVKLEDGVLHTFPLAGTRPRGKTKEEDIALEKDLLADPKELAEHNMLVDLGRNDLGKISEFGSVEVEEYHCIRRYSHVMHIGSTVRGKIRSDCDALDAVKAVLPAGTLSGAPKIMACKIINRLENNKRGIYGGAIGYIDFTGNLDTCIAIRIAYKKNGKVFVRSGAGIVADSIPENEHRECLNKAAAVITALKKSETERM